MAADSNAGFGPDFDPLLHYNSRMLSFQTDVVNSTAEMASEVMCSSSGNHNTAGSFPSGSPDMFGNSPATFNAGTSFWSGHREWVRGLKHDSGLAVDWTNEEQNMLNEGLRRYAGEGHVMKYIKIAALLPNKNVRDVALRIRWLVKQEIAKRHKLEEHYAGKRIRERKEKMLHSYSSRNVHMVPPGILFSTMKNHAGSRQSVSCEVSTVDGPMQQLMDETNQVLGRITTNLGLLKLQDNIDLFCHTRSNILSILNSMSSMPGIMSQMPPLPIPINDELLCSISQHTNQAQANLFRSHDDFNVKQ